MSIQKPHATLAICKNKCDRAPGHPNRRRPGSIPSPFRRMPGRCWIVSGGKDAAAPQEMGWRALVAGCHGEGANECLNDVSCNFPLQFSHLHHPLPESLQLKDRLTAYIHLKATPSPFAARSVELYSTHASRMERTVGEKLTGSLQPAAQSYAVGGRVMWRCRCRWRRPAPDRFWLQTIQLFALVSCPAHGRTMVLLL